LGLGEELEPDLAALEPEPAEVEPEPADVAEGGAVAIAPKPPVTGPLSVIYMWHKEHQHMGLRAMGK